MYVIHILQMNVLTMELYQKYRFENAPSTICRNQNNENIVEAYQKAAQKVGMSILSICFEKKIH